MPVEFLLSMLRRQAASSINALAPLAEQLLQNRLDKIEFSEMGEDAPDSDGIPPFKAALGSETPLFDLDLTYKVQTRAGGIAQVVGMARDFARGEKLVVVLGDNIFERSQSAAIAAWASGGDRAMIFVKDVPDPENFGVVVYEDGRVVDIVEKAGVVDKRYAAPPTNEAVVGLYCFPPDVFDVISRLEPSSRGELEITDVNRHYAQQGRLDVVRVEGWWEDAGKHWQHLADIGRRIDETGANKREGS